MRARRRRPLLAQLDEDLVAPVAERDASLRGVEAHDDAITVFEPKLTVRQRRDGEIAVALNPGARELRGVAQFVDLARRLRRGQGAEAGERAEQRERIGPALKGQGSAPDPGSRDE